MLQKFKQQLYNSPLLNIVNIFIKKEINPNILTLLGLISGLLLAYFIYKSKFIIALLLLFISGFFDISDGWVARKTNRVTKFGSLLDTISDKYVEGFIGLSLAFIIPKFILPGYFWVILAVFGSILISLISNIGSALTEKEAFKLMARADRGGLLVIGLILAKFLGIVYLTYTIIIMAVLTHLTVIILMIEYYKILKK